MTEQYSYHALNSLLVYCCLVYMFCFATFHILSSINHHVGNDVASVVLAIIISLIIAYTVLP